MSDGDSIEFHNEGEWTAVYLNGNLVRVGDSYLADEWLQTRYGVVTVDDDAFMQGQSQASGVAKTLDEVRAYATARQERLDRAAELRAEAKRLEDEANSLVDAR